MGFATDTTFTVKLHPSQKIPSKNDDLETVAFPFVDDETLDVPSKIEYASSVSHSPILFVALLFLLGLPACSSQSPRPVDERAAHNGAVRCTLTNAGLAEELRRMLVDARFDEVLDLGPVENAACPSDLSCQTKTIAQLPNVDIAVIAFPAGCPPIVANVMLSQDFPNGQINTFDARTRDVQHVRWRRWDIDRWNGLKGWHDNPARTDDEDVVPGLSGPDFAIPYPASTFKLLVAVQIMRLVEQKRISLADVLLYENASQPVHEWMRAMITQSDNTATRALLGRLHAVGGVHEMNATLAALGLRTLRVDETNPDGTGWNPGRIHMGAWDTARLLWLLDEEAPEPTWITPEGNMVPTNFLSGTSKMVLRKMLHEQGWHEALSTTALCGMPKTVPGIPARLDDVWVQADGSVDLAESHLSRNARPCNENAMVFFDHKTGSTHNYASDAGIVRGISGKAKRHYIVTFFSNLGYRYTDADKLDGEHPCLKGNVCYTQRIPALGAKLDTFLARYLE